MTRTQAFLKLRDIIRRKHKAGCCVLFATWLMVTQKAFPARQSSRPSSLNSPIRTSAPPPKTKHLTPWSFFYKEALVQPLGDVSALRAIRPATIRTAPPVEQVIRLLAACKDIHGYPTRLIVHLLYGCGLRVTEPCNLRAPRIGSSIYPSPFASPSSTRSKPPD